MKIQLHKNPSSYGYVPLSFCSVLSAHFSTVNRGDFGHPKKKSIFHFIISYCLIFPRLFSFILLNNIYIMSIISHRQYNFESLKQYYFGKPYMLCVQSHPEDRGDFGQGSTENILECNNQLELSIHNI